MAITILESAITMTWSQRSHWAGARTLPKRPARWRFLSLGTVRQRLFHRAGRLIYPGGELTPELNAHAAVQDEFLRYLKALTAT